MGTYRYLKYVLQMRFIEHLNTQLVTMLYNRYHTLAATPSRGVHFVASQRHTAHVIFFRLYELSPCISHSNYSHSSDLSQGDFLSLLFRKARNKQLVLPVKVTVTFRLLLYRHSFRHGVMRP
jgi:hypothetical protein